LQPIVFIIKKVVWILYPSGEGQFKCRFINVGFYSQAAGQGAEALQFDYSDY